jgi:hypothetical protein
MRISQSYLQNLVLYYMSRRGKMSKMCSWKRIMSSCLLQRVGFFFSLYSSNLWYAVSLFLEYRAMDPCPLILINLHPASAPASYRWVRAFTHVYCEWRGKSSKWPKVALVVERKWKEGSRSLFTFHINGGGCNF